MELYLYRLTDHEGFTTNEYPHANRNVSETVKDNEFIVKLDEDREAIEISFDGITWISARDLDVGIIFTAQELEDFCTKTPINLVKVSGIWGFQ